MSSAKKKPKSITVLLSINPQTYPSLAADLEQFEDPRNRAERIRVLAEKGLIIESMGGNVNYPSSDKQGDRRSSKAIKSSGGNGLPTFGGFS